MSLHLEVDATDGRARTGAIRTARGVIDTHDVVFFLLFVAFFLFLTLQALGSRAWRGVR